MALLRNGHLIFPPTIMAGLFHMSVSGNIGFYNQKGVIGFAGHFVGVHALGGQYNIGNLNNHISFLGTDLSVLSDRRYQGWFAGGGIAYGYAWILNKRWNLEAELGLGWIYTRYDSYPCTQCGTKIADGKSHNYVGPTKAAVNLIYTF